MNIVREREGIGIGIGRGNEIDLTQSAQEIDIIITGRNPLPPSLL